MQHSTLSSLGRGLSKWQSLHWTYFSGTHMR